MPNCLLLGDRSDIGRALKPLLEADGWKITGWNRDHRTFNLNGQYRKWDLAIVTVGTVAPVGLWMDVDSYEWESSIRSNLMVPVRLLRANWSTHNPGASICMFAGSNPNMIMDGYSAYNTGKMGLLKLVEQLDHETADAKFFALAPGIVNTKIHHPTLLADWPNHKLKAALADGKSTPIPRIYECLKWCISMPKEKIGGRNICVSDPWEREWFARDWLYADNFKLRRQEPED